MVKWAHVAWLALASALAAAPDSAPAVVMDSSPASRTDIQQAVTNALGKEVLIADDALTTSSLLIIERHTPRTIEGRIASGRILDAPEVFQLVLEKDRCVLVHRRTDVAYPLENARCRAASPAPDRDASSNQNR